MSIEQDEQAGSSSVPRLLTSVPWVVVLLGVSLLTVLLLVTLVSLRGPEQQSAVPPPAPPIYLPTVGAMATSAPPSDAPLVAVDASASPSLSASGTPSPRASSARPSVSASGVGAAPRSGTLSARYQATASERDYFEAQLTVSNGSARSQDWQVELLFSGNVKSIHASSGSGLSVTSQGSGAFVLRGTGPLGAGQSAVVQMRFSRTGTGDRPGQCTVNGTACVIG
ncbi:cellulose binding domain-containing protein [Micromonospora sp. IBHARD004]|uniref:cellulose binding domain-containing protein n=1 Tax=Micromonospora sp. IBHARD004 TaxID=3457764 RepID=UPI0040582ADC